MKRNVLTGLMVAYLTILLALTLGGFYQPRAPINMIPLRSMAYDLRVGGQDLVVNFVGNLVAFLPMGWMIPAWLGSRRPYRDVALASLSLSSFIEILQGLSGRRVADVDDVILNTVGGLAGLAIVEAWRRVGPRLQKA